MSNLIYQIEKNGGDVVRFEVSEFKGKEYINIRIWYETPNGEYKPTQKGITLELSKMSELSEGMKRLEAFIADKNSGNIQDAVGEHKSFVDALDEDE